jgi:putative cardiolipin synthase
MDRGVTVKVLTNSLASNNNELAYSGYRKDRRVMLESGLSLYEFRAEAVGRGISDTPPVTAQWLLLHTKLVIVDRRTLYVGTYNLDPRSANINSEMGLIIDAAGLAAEVAGILDRDMAPDNAWRVGLDEDGRQYWESSAGRTYEAPARGWDQRLADFLYGLVPLEDQM